MLMERLLKTENKTERKVEIDAVKGLGIFLMVVGHAGAPVMIRKWIYGFHMPLFFVVAGYLFSTEKWKEKGWKKLLISRAKSYLLPYFTLFFINLVLNFCLEFIKFGGINHRLLDSTLEHILGGGIYSCDTMLPNCGPIWFLTAIFVSCIFFYILAYKRGLWRILISVLYILALILVCYILNYFKISQLPWHIDVALAGSVFMNIGNEFRRLSEMRWNKVWKDNKILQIIIAVFLLILFSILVFVNGRIIMVINQYGNIWLFLINASVLSLVILWFLLHYGGRFFLLAFWGRNSIIFLGFNYLVNTVVRQIGKLFAIENTTVICFMDILLVMTICSGIAIIRNNFKKGKKKLKVK